MAIISSQIVFDLAQADGRRHVRERHTDGLGVTHDVDYMADAGTNATTEMNNRVANIDAQLKAAEIDRNLAEAMGADL